MSEIPEESWRGGWRGWVMLVALTIGCFVLAASLFEPRFETMDDVAMAMWSSGLCLATTPSGLIVFSHPAVGALLAALYQLLPAVAWYGWMQMAILFVSSVAIGRVLLRAGDRWIGLLSYMAFLLFGLVDAIVQIQFTKTASYATLAGLMLLTSATSNERWRSPKIVVACALGLLGSLVRLESFVFACVAILPGLVLWWFPRDRRRAGIRLALFTCLPLVVAALTTAADHRGALARFYDYRIYRARALDFGDNIAYNAGTKPIFDEIGWTETHFTMFRQGSYFESQIFGPEKLARLLDAFPRRPTFADAAQKLSAYSSSLIEPCYLLPLVVALALAIIAGAVASRVAILAAIGATLGLLTGILLFLKWPPHRVVEPTVVGGLVVSCWLAMQTSSTWPRWRRPTVNLVLLIACLFQLRWMWPKFRTDSAIAEEQTRVSLSELAALHDRGDRLYVVWSNQFPYTQIFLPFNHHAALLGNHHQVGTWAMFLPSSEATLKSFEVENPYLALVDNPAIRLIASKDGAALLGRFLRDSYGKIVEVDRVTDGKYLEVWQVRSVPEPLSVSGR